MNKFINLKLVQDCGDYFQLEFGCEFGSYAKLISRDLLNVFCNEFNNDPWVYENNFYLTTKYNNTNGQPVVSLKHHLTNLNAHIKFMDHSVFIEATDSEWLKIDKKLFNRLQKFWRNFLSSNIYDYDDHINKTILLARLDALSI